jgi:hypothetical protein
MVAMASSISRISNTIKEATFSTQKDSPDPVNHLLSLTVIRDEENSRSFQIGS